MKTPLINLAEAQELVREHGSPLYVYRKSVVEARYRELESALTYPRKRIFYAMKANANLELLQYLKSLGAGIECVSRGEVERAFEAGFAPDLLSFTASNISREELRWVMEQHVHIYLDSLNQVRWAGEIHPDSVISIRLNVGYGAGSQQKLITGGEDSKFGIYYADIPELLNIAKQYDLKIVGLLQHVGTDIDREPEPFMHALDVLLEVAHQFPDLSFIDLGGGYGVPYEPNEQRLDLQMLGKQLSDRFAQFSGQLGRELELRIEPGRYVVAEAGTLLVTVTDRKRTTKHDFVGVDSGFNHLVRPMMYGAYHEIFNLTRPDATKKDVTVVGNVCETDTFAEKRMLPEPQIGDLLLIADAGAYGYSMSSDYHLRPKPKEIVLE